MDMYFPWRSIRTSAFEMHRFDILDRFFWHFLRSHFDAHNSRKISIGAQTHQKIWQLTSASSIYFLAAEHVQCMIMEWLWIAVFYQKKMSWLVKKVSMVIYLIEDMNQFCMSSLKKPEFWNKVNGFIILARSATILTTQMIALYAHEKWSVLGDRGCPEMTSSGLTK